MLVLDLWPVKADDSVTNCFIFVHLSIPVYFIDGKETSLLFNSTKYSSEPQLSYFYLGIRVESVLLRLPGYFISTQMNVLLLNADFEYFTYFCLQTLSISLTFKNSRLRLGIHDS